MIYVFIPTFFALCNNYVVTVTLGAYGSVRDNAVSYITNAALEEDTTTHKIYNNILFLMY